MARRDPCKTAIKQSNCDFCHVNLWWIWQTQNSSLSRKKIYLGFSKLRNKPKQDLWISVQGLKHLYLLWFYCFKTAQYHKENEFMKFEEVLNYRKENKQSKSYWRPNGLRKTFLSASEDIANDLKMQIAIHDGMENTRNLQDQFLYKERKYTETLTLQSTELKKKLARLRWNIAAFYRNI